MSPAPPKPTGRPDEGAHTVQKTLQKGRRETWEKGCNTLRRSFQTRQQEMREKESNYAKDGMSWAGSLALAAEFCHVNKEVPPRPHRTPLITSEKEAQNSHNASTTGGSQQTTGLPPGRQYPATSLQEEGKHFRCSISNMYVLKKCNDTRT